MTAKKVLYGVQGLDYAEESAFSVDPGSHTAVRAFDIEVSPERAFYDVLHAKSEAFRGPDARVAGGKGGTLKFKAYLRNKNGAEAAVLSLMKRMGATLSSCAAKSQKITGGSANTVTMLDADAADLSVGMALYHTPTTGAGSVRFIKRVQSSGGTTTITVNANWAQTPVNLDSLAAIDTITPTAGDPAKTFSFSAYQGSGAGDTIKWTFTGCTGKWSLDTVEAGGLPVVSFEFSADAYVAGTGGLTQGADAMDPARPILGDSFLLGGSAVDVRSLSFDPRQEYAAIQAVSGSNGRSGWIHHGTSPRVVITPLHDADHFTGRDSVTQYDAQFESIYSVNSAWSFWIAGGYLDEVTAQESNGLVRNEIAIVGRDPGKNADGVAYPIWAFAITR